MATTYTYNNHSYLLSDAGTWTEAEAQAVSLGGHLVTINNQAEQDWLVSTFKGFGNYLWIGYTDQETEGNWKWISGENSTYTNWISGQPDNWYGGAGEDYAHLHYYVNWKWNDLRNYDSSTGAMVGIIEINNINEPILPTWQEILTQSGGYYSTFADLAKAAYHLASGETLAPDQVIPSLVSYTPDPDGNYVKPYADEAFGRVQKNWHILTSSDLGKDATSGDYRWVVISGQIGTTNASMTDLGNAVTGIGYDYGNTVWTLEKDGIYHGNNAAAFAVRCDDAVVISFRGTNDNDNTAWNSPSFDMTDWADMTEHYGELLAFVNKIDGYISSNNIKKVYVTGHSLGGGMALAYMDKHQANSNTTADGSIISYEAVTFAAPGFLVKGSLDPRVVCVEIDGDPVPDIKYHQGFVVTADVAELTHTELGTNQGKNYSGSDYHSMDLYQQVAKTFDSELPDTTASRNDSGNIHGFRPSMFDTLSYSLEVSIKGTEAISSSDPWYTWDNQKDLKAPQFTLMNANDTLTDTTNFGYTQYFLGGAGQDTIGAGGGYPDNGILGGRGSSTAIANVMIGGADDDTYYVDNKFDIVTEKTNAGTDTVNSSISYTLPDNIELLNLTGTAKINGTGNSFINSLTGNAVANILNGGIGTDIMRGDTGNDIYFVDNIGDEVHEISISASEIDTVNSTVSYTLPANVENLNLTGNSAINGFGNDSRNILTGNSAANKLSGGVGLDKLIGAGGKDILTGGIGLDIFIFNNTSDSTVSSPDVITDFTVGTVNKPIDKIDLSAIDANITTTANDSFLTLDLGINHRVFKFTNALYFNTTTHILYGNNDADKAADFSILLSGVTTLNKADFVL